LAQTVIYLCASPKSNSSYLAINAALQAIANGLHLEIPKHLKQQSDGKYLYPHDFGGYVKQQYLAKPLKFVELKDIGYEKKMKEWHSALENL
jgi:putative ATPase